MQGLGNKDYGLCSLSPRAQSTVSSIPGRIRSGSHAGTGASRDSRLQHPRGVARATYVTRILKQQEDSCGACGVLREAGDYGKHLCFQPHE